MRDLTLVTSIDTEEDDWIPRRGRGDVSNLREVPRLQAFLDRFGVRATYFVTYRVVTDERAAKIVRYLHDSRRAEIGAHLHPWNTPPVTEKPTDRNTMFSNLPPSLQARKIRRLTSALSDLLGPPPNSFRAGRYGFGAATVRALLESGYGVDSSVTPFIDWSHMSEGPNHSGAPVEVYRLGADTTDVRVPSSDGTLVEVPISCGFTRRPFGLWARVDRVLRTRPFRRSRLLGVAAKTGLMNRVVLSPEEHSVEDMLRLSRRLYEMGTRFVHWTWHSPSLRPGLSPFVRSAQELDRFYDTMQAYLERLPSIAPLRFATVSEAAARLMPSTDRVVAGNEAARGGPESAGSIEAAAC